MEKEIKIIASGRYWYCENMDTLAPICEEGTEYLLSDGTTIQDPDYINAYAPHYNKDMSAIRERLASLQRATKEEIKAYASQEFGYIFKGDKVVIKRGRKMKGETKEVRGYYRYDVPGTYGHQYTEYLLFTDGTKVNINHCDVLGVDHNDKPYYNGVIYYFRRYEEDLSISTFHVGGRL